MKILVITLNNIGDVLLTLPSIQFLRHRFPSAKISVVVGERASSLLLQDPRYEKVWVDRKKIRFAKRLSLFGELARQRFDLVINFRDLFSSMLSGDIKNVFNKKFWKPRKRKLHRKERHFEHLIRLGIAEIAQLNRLETDDALWISEDCQKRMRELLKQEGVSEEGGWILVAPGSLSFTKRWPVEKFIQLCNTLVKERSAHILLVGEEQDRLMSQKIAQVVSSNGLTDLCGRTDLLGLAYLVKKAGILITHDSAPLHMASLLGTPVVAIFGPTNPEKYGPWRENSQMIRKEFFCSPCEKSLCVYHHECMERIEPQEVMEAVRKLVKV